MKIRLKNFQSPGDVLMLTAAVRDFKLKYPDTKIWVETSSNAFFDNNPNIENLKYSTTVYNTSAKVKESPYAGIPTLNVGYDDDKGKIDNPWSIHKVHNHKKHFIYGMIGYINCKLGLDIELTKPHADLYLTDEEKKPLSDLPENYWLVNCGTGPFFPAKIWHKDNWMTLFKSLPNITFVQMGGSEKDHQHPSFGLPNVMNYIGQTSFRQSLSMIYNARGLIVPITYAMHVVAAIAPKKPCIVVAGGREQWWWEAYEGHDFLHTMGSLPCCTIDHACWKSECINKANNGGAKCLELIEPKMVAKLVREHESKQQCLTPSNSRVVRQNSKGATATVSP
jgi:ADP-heptose:LPS heptosyltransferase